MPAKYDLQRNIFQKWNQVVSGDAELKTHLESAIRKVLTEYDTAIRENRFIVGGVIEYLVLAAINGSGVGTGKHVGTTEKGADILIELHENKPCSAKFSIKYSSSGAVRILNVLGESVKAEWSEPTIFVLPEVGIVYADPAHIPAEAIHRKADVIDVERKSILLHAQKHPELTLVLVIPKKKDLTAQQTTKTASEDVARTIIKQYSRLVL